MADTIVINETDAEIEAEATRAAINAVKLTNLTNSPYDLQSKNGPVRLPALGTVTGEFEGAYLDLLEIGGSVKVEESEPKPKRGRPRKQETADGH